jgi:glycerophosphoryl diester phosphodiesterase
MGNVWLRRRVLCYAHQGGASEGPSSTLFAIEQAIRNGASAIELDVHQSADGVLVVCHDSTLDRTTNLRGAIATYRYGEIAAADNAYWFVPGRGAVGDEPASAYPYRGRAADDLHFRIATLESVLAEFPGIPLNLDIKQSAPAVAPYEGALAELLLRYGRVDDVIVTSFSDRSIKVFHEIAPPIGTAPGTSALTMIVQSIRGGVAVGPELLDGHVALQVPLKIAGVSLVDERLVSVAHDLKLALHVWTVDDVADMHQLVGLGVDGIMTDVPSVLAAVLRRYGAAAADA